MTRRPGALASAASVLVLLAASPAFAQAGRLGGGGSPTVSIVRIVAALIICIVIAVLAVLLIRQRRGDADLQRIFGRLHPRTRAIEVVETRRLSQHGDICVVRHGGREYLLLLLAGQAQLLSNEAAAPAEGEQPCA